MKRFRKEGAPPRADAFAAEADGLEALRPHIRVPQVLDRGIHNGKAFIVLEYLDLKRGGDFAAAGRACSPRCIARPGRASAGRATTTSASTPQQNGWCDDWVEFWREQRMRPQLALAKKQGLRAWRCRDSTLLEGHQPQPSLLHGDLWSGNAGFTAEGPVVFDPAVYYGDREADLAMTELFGGFPQEFYRGVQRGVSAYRRDTSSASTSTTCITCSTTSTSSVAATSRR